MNIKEELLGFEKKYIDNENLFMSDLDESLSSIDNKISIINKNLKKESISINLLKDDLDNKKNEIIDLKKQLKFEKNSKEKIVKKILLILDEVYNIEKFTIDYKNAELKKNIDTIKIKIKKELREIGIEEISDIGEIFNNDLHECIDTRQDNDKLKYEIIDVVNKGYKFNDKVIRTAKVIANK